MCKRTWYIQENFKEFKVLKAIHRSIISNEDPPGALVDDESKSVYYNADFLYKKF